MAISVDTPLTPSYTQSYTNVLTSDTKAVADNAVGAFKARLKEIVSNFLPTDGYIDKNSSTIPNGIDVSYLCSRAELISDINDIIDDDDTIVTNNMLNATAVYSLIKKVFIEMGRCRRVVSAYVSGTDAGYRTLPEDLHLENHTGTFCYFNKSFTFNQNYVTTASALPMSQGSETTCDITRYSSAPLGTVGWNNNTSYTLNTTRVAELATNLKDIASFVEDQMNNFGNDEKSINNLSFLWNGSYDSPNGSNKIVMVRYWCHTNCHNNCHSNCHSSRGRR